MNREHSKDEAGSCGSLPASLPRASLEDVLRVIDSCGGTQTAGDSDDFHAGYNAALDACEDQMKRAWLRISGGLDA